MRTASTTEILNIIQQKLTSKNARTFVKLEVYFNDNYQIVSDLDEETGIDWSESGKKEKYAAITLTPLSGGIKFNVFNYNGRYGFGSGDALEGLFDLNTKIRLSAGYDVTDEFSESSQSLNLNDISGSIINSYFYRTEHSAGTVIIDPDGTQSITHFSGWFTPLYDSETYYDSMYTPDAYTVQTYDASGPDFEQFNYFTVTANNSDGKIYYRTFDDPELVGVSTGIEWAYAENTTNGTSTIDFTDIKGKRFLQIAIVYDGITWDSTQIISDITVYYQSRIEWIYQNIYYLDTPEFDDPPVGQIPRVFCAGRDSWKKALETEIDIEDYTAGITPANFIKAVCDKCGIKYSATSIASITGFSNITWDSGFGEPKKAADVFEMVMQKIQPTGYQMYMQYDSTLDDSIMYVQQKPTPTVADGAFSYKNYVSIGNSRKNADKIIQRYTVITDQQVVDPEIQLDQESISSTGDKVFDWSGSGEAIYVRFEADYPDNIRGTVVKTNTGATLTVTSVTGTVVVTAYGNLWSSTAPTYEGEAISFNNMIYGKGTTARTINPLMSSDAECKSSAESFINDFSDPVQESQGLVWPYVNLLPEINDTFVLWRRFIFDDNMYFITKISHHWNGGKTPGESTSFSLDDSGANFSDNYNYVWDDTPTAAQYDVGFVWDMGISTPLATDAEIDAASPLIHNVDCT